MPPGLGNGIGKITLCHLPEAFQLCSSFPGPGSGLRGVGSTRGKVKLLQVKVVEKIRIYDPRNVDNASCKGKAE